MDAKKLEELAKALVDSLKAETGGGKDVTKSGRKVPTVSETLEAAFKCTTREQADKLMEDTCEILAEFTESSVYKYEDTIRKTLGKEAVAHGPEVSFKMYELFDAEHPVFGPPEKYWNMTMKELWDRQQEFKKEETVRLKQAEEEKKKSLEDIAAKLEKLKKGLSVNSEEEAA